jgi:ubiquitin
MFNSFYVSQQGDDLMPTETAPKTFDQAYEEAKTSVEKPEPAPVETVEKPSEGDTKEGETPKAEETKPVESQPEETTEESELLTKEEVSKLSESDKASYKKMQKAFTQKTQKLSEERKALEQNQRLIDAFEADPVGTLKALAPKFGLKFAEEEAKKEVQQQAVDTVAEQMKDQLRQLLGAENEALADGLANIFENGIKAAIPKVVEREVAPIKQAQEQAQFEAVKASTESDLKAFSTRHPDWKTHEKTMLEISKTIIPAPGSDTAKWLDTLYYLATKDQTAAQQTAAVVKRINEAASKAEPPDTAVNTTRVTPAAPKKPTFEEAFKAAKSGVAW